MNKPHNVRKNIIRSNFTTIINTVPKHIVEIHETKKIEASNEISTSKTNHILFEFTKPKTSDTENNTLMENDNVVEYIVDDYVDMSEIYTVEDDNISYNPMYFSLRHYISGKN